MSCNRKAPVFSMIAAQNSKIPNANSFIRLFFRMQFHIIEKIGNTRHIGIFMYLQDDWIMVSTNAAYDIDFINSAHENICLIADKTWAFHQQDSYRRLNQCLWVQSIRSVEKFTSNSQKSSHVRDVIPGSLLARYGNYLYNEEREKLYKPNQAPSDDLVKSNLHVTNSSTTSPWLLNDVEECFAQLTSQTLWINELDFNGESADFNHPSDDDYNKYCPLPYTVGTPAELQLQMRISHDVVRNLWESTETATSNHDTACKLNDNNHKRRIARCNPREIGYIQPSTSILRRQKISRDPKAHPKSTIPLLSAEVPEFFPKRPGGHYDSVPLQYFPSTTERFYPEKIFTFNRPHLPTVSTIFQNPGIPLVAPPIMTPLIRSHHPWIPRIAPPPLQIQIPVCTIGPQTLTSICPIIHRPIQLHDKIIPAQSQMGPAPIPVYQRPPELYQEHKRKTQGVDFNNLILLTKNAIKARRNPTKNPLPSSTFILESIQPHIKTDNDVIQWLNKSYPKQTKELITINSLVTDLRNLGTNSNIVDVKTSDSNQSEPDNDNDLEFLDDKAI